MASNASVILSIVFPLMPFYITYIISAFIDAWFIQKGRTIYITINSILVNIVYYGIVYILFKQGIFATNITFIILMFGFGMVVHLLVSIVLYNIENRKLRKKLC